jgi:hypothetical protein
MNLAQLIDPERAREGWGDPRPAKPSPMPPRGLVTHTATGDVEGPIDATRLSVPINEKREQGLAAMVRRLLAERPGLTLPEILNAIGGRTSPQLSNCLKQLQTGGQLVAAGVRGKLRYTITDKGRARL